MATCAQLINNLNALFLAHEEHFIATSNFHVFAMYSAHQGGQALRAEFSAPDVQYTRDDKPARFWGLNGSASRKGQNVTLTIVNPGLSKTMETQIALRRRTVARVSGIVLASSDMHAHNTFDQPNAVMPATLPVTSADGLLNVSIPPASVARLDVSLG
jgi:alpha-L-arabinofuranosidase